MIIILIVTITAVKAIIIFVGKIQYSSDIILYIGKNLDYIIFAGKMKIIKLKYYNGIGGINYHYMYRTKKGQFCYGLSYIEVEYIMTFNNVYYICG